MEKKQSGKIALCGMLGALSVVVLLMGNILPFATFCAPGIAGMVLLPVAAEYGRGTALTLYSAVSLLCLLFVPDKEMACAFIFLLGYYPLLKMKLDGLRPAVLRILAKLAVFNGAIAAMYTVLLVLFPVHALVEEYAQEGRTGVLILLALGNVTFLVYDAAIVNIKRIYRLRLRPRLARYL